MTESDRVLWGVGLVARSGAKIEDVAALMYAELQRSPKTKPSNSKWPAAEVLKRLEPAAVDCLHPDLSAQLSGWATRSRELLPKRNEVIHAAWIENLDDRDTITIEKRGWRGILPEWRGIDEVIDLGWELESHARQGLQLIETVAQALQHQMLDGNRPPTALSRPITT